MDELLGAAGAAAACMLVCTVCGFDMCASPVDAGVEPPLAPADDVPPPLTGFVPCAAFVDARLEWLAADFLLPDALAAGVAGAGLAACVGVLDALELAWPEPPQPAAVTASATTTGRKLRGWEPGGIDILLSRQLSAMAGLLGLGVISHT